LAKRSVTTVSGRHDAITEIQRDFLRHPGFVYFRKGEFKHALDVAWMHMDLLSLATGYGVKVASGLTVQLLKERLDLGRNGQTKVPGEVSRDLRFLMSEGNASEDSLFGAKTLEELGWKRGVIAAERAGRFRYFVSSREYFLFFGQRDGTLHGIRGKDEETRESLRNLFLDEWIAQASMEDGA
jgi:hypothetical protein